MVREYSNPPFAPEILRIYDLTGNGKFNLQRGFMRSDISNAANPATADIFKLRFLYNPSTVSLSHRVDINRPGQAVEGDGYTAPLMPMSQSLQFSLLFDRTYDVLRKKPLPNRGNVGLQELGVYADILTLYDMLSITRSTVGSGNSKDNPYDPFSGDIGSSLAGVGAAAAAGAAAGAGRSGGIIGKVKAFLDGASTGTNGTYYNRPVGPMLYTAVRIYFGSQLAYRAVVQSVDVQYTHWTQKMVPSRCTVDINVDLLTETSDSAQTEAKYFPKPFGSPSVFRR